MRTIPGIDQDTEIGASVPLDSIPPTDDQVVCTLFEGDFHYGVAALANSLIRGGFRGLIWAGFRGELPPWTTNLRKLSNGLFDVGGAILGFEEIETHKHFTQFKPEFMATLFRKGLARKNLWYFDPDITVRCSWSFFEQWVEYGVALCQDITMGSMPFNHPIRCKWMQVARAAGWDDPPSDQQRYYNGGFVGLTVDRLSFLTIWQRALELAYSHGVPPDVLKKGRRELPFNTPDQDALNIATMYSDVPLSAIGPEGMGFVPGGFTMYHSLGSAKPWRKNFLRYALQGIPPSNGDKHYLACAGGPLHPYTAARLRILRAQAAVATAIGRFYRKN